LAIVISSLIWYWVLTSWLRFSREEALDLRDGLTAEPLGLEGFARFVWYSFYKEKTALGKSFRKAGVRAARKQLDNGAGFVIITSPDESTASLLGAGCLCLRVELACSRLSVAHHTMSQLMEKRPRADKIQSELRTQGPVQFMMRLGYAEYTPAPSIRRSVEEFTNI
jgi:hypothetical protein